MKTASDAPSFLKVEGVSKQYGRFTALRDVSFEARRGEFISILGPSGCGKTTILRIIAGLESQTKGRVLIHGRDVSDLPVSRRNVGIVFQSYALFPNLTARQNVAYGLMNTLRDRKDRDARASELMSLVGLPDAGGQYPAQLSGGQQQRVALARAMALSPDLLLLDEPLSALDAQVRVMLRSEIRALQQRLCVTTIMVTHDQEEALTMADRILVMNTGDLVQDGLPTDVYDRPATPFVAAFIGSMNFMSDAVKLGEGLYGIGSHQLTVSRENGTRALPAGNPVILAIRPEDILIHPPESRDANTFVATVRRMEYRGPLFRLSLSLPVRGGDEARVLEADVPAEKIRRFNIQESMTLPIRLPGDRLRVYAGRETPHA